MCVFLIQVPENKLTDHLEGKDTCSLKDDTVSAKGGSSMNI